MTGKTFELGSKQVNAGAGWKRLSYEPGHAIVKIDGATLIVKPGTTHDIFLREGMVAPTVELVPGRMKMAPLED